MATSPAVSGVKERIIRERQIPPEELAAERSGKMPDMWEVIDSLAQRPQRWIDEDWWLAIVREDPKPSTYGGQNTLEQCQGVMEVRPGVSITLDDREKIELGIKQKYGGKAYRLLLKKGRQKISESKCINEAQPKYPEMNGVPVHPLPNAGTASNSDSVVLKAMDTVASQPQEVMNIAIGALRTAAELIGKNATAPPQPNPPQPSVADDLEREFKRAMITRMTADPVESFIRMRAALAPPANETTNNTNTLVEKVLTVALDKLLNPPAPTVAGRTTLLDLGREFIPVLGSTVRETMHEYRLSREADARIAELSRMQPQPVPAAGPQPMPPMPVIEAMTTASHATAPAPTQPTPAAANPSLTFQQIEAHIAKIVRNLEYPIDEAVDRVLSFLYDTDGRLVAALLNPPSLDPRLKPGKEGLMQLFTYEPELNPCMVNTPRVSEFIDKFIAAATIAEATEARLRAAAPTAVEGPSPSP